MVSDDIERMIQGTKRICVTQIQALDFGAKARSPGLPQQRVCSHDALACPQLRQQKSSIWEFLVAGSLC